MTFMKTFDSNSFLYATRHTGFYLRVDPRSGSISFSRELFVAFNSSGIKFNQDENNPMEWFIEPSEKENAFKFRQSASKTSLIQSCPLAREILSSCNLPLVTTRFLVSNEPSDHGFAIITKSAKQKEKLE